MFIESLRGKYGHSVTTSNIIQKFIVWWEIGQPVRLVSYRRHGGQYIRNVMIEVTVHQRPEFYYKTVNSKRVNYLAEYDTVLGLSHIKPGIKSS